MQSLVQVFKSQWRSILAFVIVVICLLPILETSLYSDDLQGFESRNGCAEYQSKSLIERANPEIVQWEQLGRFNPVGIYLTEFCYKYFKTIESYKIFLFALNLIAIICFLSLVSIIGLKNLIPLFLLFYAGGIQLRIQDNDVYTSFTGGYQTLSICIFLCLLFFILYSRTKSYILLACSVILFTCAFLISEIGLSLLIFLFICAKIEGQSWKKSIAATIPFLIIGTIYVLYVLQIRTHVTQFYSGVSTNFKMFPMATVLGIQLFAALPFSNLLNQYSLVGRLIQELDTYFNIISIILIIVIFSLIMANLIRNAPIKRQPVQLWLIALALALLFIPIIFIMPSVKYQTELDWGKGYLPVYIQNFGMALCLALGAKIIASASKKWSKPVFIGFLGIGLLSSISAFLANSDSIKLKNYNSSFPPEALYDDIKAGILSDCAPGSSIILNNDFFWNSTSFYSNISGVFTGKKFTFLLKKDWKPSLNDSYQKPCFLLSCDKGDTIFVKLYKLNCATGDELSLLKCYRNYHNIRLSDIDKHTTLKQ